MISALTITGTIDGRNLEQLREEIYDKTEERIKRELLGWTTWIVNSIDRYGNGYTALVLKV